MDAVLGSAQCAQDAESADALPSAPAPVLAVPRQPGTPPAEKPKPRRRPAKPARKARKATRPTAKPAAESPPHKPSYTRAVHYSLETRDRPPDWRFLKARALHERGLDPNVFHCDEPTQALHHLLQRLGDDAAAVSVPPHLADLREAQSIYSEDQARRWVLEAAILAGESDAAIADRLGLRADVVAAYERAFFALRDWEGRSRDNYVLFGVVRVIPLLEPCIANVLRVFAFENGSLMLDEVLHLLGMPQWASSPRPTGPETEPDFLSLRALIAGRLVPITAQTSAGLERQVVTWMELQQSDAPEAEREVAYRQFLQAQIKLLRRSFTPSRQRTNPLLRALLAPQSQEASHG